jgi:hypothetical protein
MHLILAYRSRSGFFCDMLMDSAFTSSVDNPIILEEHSKDVKTIFTIIAGCPCQAEKRCLSWKTGKRLYLLMQKYQLDRLQPWFSTLAGKYAGDSPFEALGLACTNPCFDENLARRAILYGLEDTDPENLFDPDYLKLDHAEIDEDRRKTRLLDPSNMKVKLYLDLGFKGSVAYCQTFSDLGYLDTIDWQGVADDFIDAVRQFEEERETSVSIS